VLPTDLFQPPRSRAYQVLASETCSHQCNPGTGTAPAVSQTERIWAESDVWKGGVASVGDHACMDASGSNPCLSLYPQQRPIPFRRPRGGERRNAEVLRREKFGGPKLPLHWWVLPVQLFFGPAVHNSIRFKYSHSHPESSPLLLFLQVSLLLLFFLTVRSIENALRSVLISCDFSEKGQDRADISTLHRNLCGLIRSPRQNRSQQDTR
jgi:hypothetical protein